MVIPRDQHIISRQQINHHALKVLYRLQEAGFDAFLVGGGVRDLLLGMPPKDFDVVTNARPQEVRKLFRNSLLIGRRFRLVHVRFGLDVIEVATYRGVATDDAEQQHSEAGMLLRDNVYGSQYEDAWRRDFTVNALYYNIADFSVLDYVEGMTDIKAKQIKMIGDANKRYHEDPVRILRAIRLAAKLNFTIEKNTEIPIFELGGLLQNVSPSRLFDEIIKVFHSGAANVAFDRLRHYGLFAILFPQVEAFLTEEDNLVHVFLEKTFRSMDARFADDLSLNPAFIFAALLWWPLQKMLSTLESEGMKRFQALNLAMDEVVRKQVKLLKIPRRFVVMMREIWLLQFSLPRHHGKRVYRCFHHPRFRAAYDFLVLRAEAGEPVEEVAQWWGEFQKANSDTRRRFSKQRRSQRKQAHDE